MIGLHFATDLATLDGLTYAPTDVDGNVFVDWMPDTPNLAVAVMHGAGLPQMTRNADDLPTLQVIVRGEQHDPASALLLCRAIYDRYQCRDGWELTGALDADGDPIPPVWVSGCSALQSAPVPMGRDQLDRPEYSLNFSLLTHNPTTHRS